MSADTATATASSAEVEVAVDESKKETTRPANITVEVTIRKDPKGLGLVIGLSKKSKSNPDKPQVVFIRALQRRKDGTQSEAVKNGEMMPQDVVEAVNDLEVGADLNVLTGAINEIPINGDIKFRLSRRAKDEARRVKSLQDKEKADKLDLQLRVLFNAIDEAGNGDGSLTIDEIDAVGKDVFLDKLGLHLPDSVRKEGFKSLEEFSQFGDNKISFEEFRGVLYGKEIALACQKTRYAKYAVIFKKLDTDGNHSITRSEFIKADELIKKLFGEGSDALKAEFESMELDTENTISFTEFCNGCEAFYQLHMHPDGYEAVDGSDGSWTVPEAVDEVDEETVSHYDEDHTEDAIVPEVLSQVPSVLMLETEEVEEEAKDGEEDKAEPSPTDKIIEAAKKAHEAALAKKEKEAMDAHKKEVADRERAEAKQREEAAAKKKREEEAEEKAAAAPASGGCCTIA